MKRCKMNFKNLYSSLFIIAAIIAVSACASTEKVPSETKSSSKSFTEGVPGGIIVNTVTVNAKVVSIDKKERTATLLRPDKLTISVKAGPEALNFNKIEKGDMVTITYFEEFVVALMEKGSTVDEGTSGMITLAPAGGKPGGFATKTKLITGTVTAINKKKRTATLKFTDGTTKTYPVRKDIDLTKYKKGEKVAFRITEMIAIDIVKN